MMTISLFFFYSTKRISMLDFPVVSFVLYYYCFWWAEFKLSFCPGQKFFCYYFSQHLFGLRSYLSCCWLSGMSILVNVFVSDTCMGIESIRLTDFGFLIPTYSCFLTQVEQDFYSFFFFILTFGQLFMGFTKSTYH